MKAPPFEVPAQFARNSSKVIAEGLEKTGTTIMNAGNELLGWPDLGGRSVLDVGCGVRFTQTILNCELPIGSYTGIDIDEPLITHLRGNVPDSRFAYHFWPVYNELYNRVAPRLTRRSRLPLPDGSKFDVIWMYSVITHNYPAEAELLFRILRRHIQPEGGLVFSAFIDNSLRTFEDRLKDQPLVNAYYNEQYLRKLLSRAGWIVEATYDKRPDSVMQNLFLCRPKPRLWGIFPRV